MADGTLAPPSIRAERKAATRLRILAAAKAMFEAHGFGGVDVRTIAASAGLSTGAIFASFASKAELYAAAIGKPAPTGALAEAAGDLLAALKAMVETYRDDCADEDQPTMVREAIAAIAKADGRA